MQHASLESDRRMYLKVAIATRNIERSSSTLMPSKISWIGEKPEEIDWPEVEGHYWNFQHSYPSKSKIDGKSKKHCRERVLSFGTLVSSFHGLTWLVNSPEKSNFTKAQQFWGETSEISSLCHCWTEEVQIWALTDWKCRPDPNYFWHACKFYGGLKQEKSVSIMTTGHKKDCFMVMLACLANGAKHPPCGV